jgi:hypothetical protein
MILTFNRRAAATVLAGVPFLGVTDDSPQEDQVADLARLFETAQEQGQPFLRAAQEFVASGQASGESTEPVHEVARQVADAMGLETTEVVVAVRRFGGFPQWPGHISASGSREGVGDLMGNLLLLTASQHASLSRPEDIRELSARASQGGR